MSTLEQIGKKMPYKVPDGFFDKSASEIMLRISLEPAKATHRRFTLTKRPLIAAAAAAVAVLIVTAVFFFNDSNKVDLMELTNDFSNLSAADQSSILDIYEGDLFLNSSND